MKKFLALLLAVMMLGSLCACSLVDKDKTNKDDETQKTDTASKFTDKELATNVVSIGKRSVTLEEYIEMFDSAVEWYNSYYGKDVTSSEEDLKNLIDMTTDIFKENMVTLNQADELGLSKLSKDQQAELDEKVAAYIKEMEDYYKSKAEEEAKTDEKVDVEARTKELILEEAVYYIGEGATYEEYIEYITDNQTDEYIMSLVEENVKSAAKVTDKEVKSWYDSKISTQKEDYTDDASQYKTDRDLIDKNGSEGYGPIVYSPKGYSRVLHIYTTSTEAFSETYTTNTTKMTEIESKYGKLALENSASSKKEMESLKKEYQTLKSANEKEKTEHYAAALEKINEAYKALKSGKKFTKVMADYTEDTNFVNYEYIKENGMLISTKYDTLEGDWSSEVKAQFKSLKKGEYSKVFFDGEGYHIVFYLDDEPSGEIAYKNVKDEIKAYMLADTAANLYADEKEKWLEDKNLVINQELLDRLSK